MTNRMINYSAFAILSLLWLGFLASLLFSPALLDSAWQSFRSWPLILQLLVGLLVLPVAAGLWIWETGWAFWLRLILVLGLAWVTVYTFFPRKARSTPQPSAVKP
jgi:hypothetical protein